MPKQRISPLISYAGKNRYRRSYFYHQILTIPFSLVFFLVLAGFLGINSLFAIVYYFLHGLIDVVHPAAVVKFSDALYFSMTFPIVGYGGLAPAGIGRAISVIQVFCGLFFLGMLTGIIFARFSQGSSPLVWSAPLVLCRQKGKTYLQVRVTNVIGNDVVNVFPKLFLQRNKYTASGELNRELLPLDLETKNIPLAAFSWIISHQLKKNSPLWAWLKKEPPQNERLVGFVHGHDSTLGKEIFSYAKWQPSDMVEGEFANILLKFSERKDLQAEVRIDLNSLDKTT